MHNLKLLILGLIFSTVSCIAWANRINQSEIVTLDLPLPVLAPDAVQSEPEHSAFATLRAVSQKELNCMSLNLYREANKRSRTDMVAVARVVMNRVADKRWPDTVCGVIYQKFKGRCQFSWTCVPSLRQVPASNDPAFVMARAVAKEVLHGEHAGVIAGANHYYASNICKPPVWTKRMTLVATIGYHLYYRG